MHKSVWEITSTWWEEVRLKVNHAVVYLDNKMAELLHWSGGIDLLLSAGAVDVKEFSSFEVAEESQKKAVFIVSSLLVDVTEEIIQDIVTGSRFQYVVVMTTASPLLHLRTSSASDSDSIFDRFEEQVLEWMGNMNYTVQVQHVPLFCAEVCANFFIAPAFADLFPLLPSDVKQIAYQYSSSHVETKKIASLEDVELHHLPNSLQEQLKLLASGLHALLQCLDVKEEIFSLGSTSRHVAIELDAYPPARSRRKAAQNKVSLILVDRTIDLASSLSYQPDTLLDKVINSLPLLAGHSSDRMIDLHQLTGVHIPSLVFPGSLATTDFSKPPTHLLPLIKKKQKEALIEVNRRLVETASSEKLPLQLSGRPGRITPEQIDSSLALFKGKYSLIRKHLDTLQVAAATSQSLKQSSSHLPESAVVTEKNLIQALADEDEVSPSGLSVISKLVLEEVGKSVNERSLTIDDILCLITYMYAASTGDCGGADQEQHLQELLIKWIKEDADNLSPVTKQAVGGKVNESILIDLVENMWSRMKSVKDVRAHLQQFKSVLVPGDAVTPGSVKSLLAQMMEKVVDPAKPELPDVDYKSTGLKDLLKSGFGFFKGSSKPRPGDAPLVILFVIGGITASEVRQITEVVDKAKPAFELLIGSTKLSSRESTLESLFVADNINMGSGWLSG